jgi:hypothetical protein
LRQKLLPPRRQVHRKIRQGKGSTVTREQSGTRPTKKAARTDIKNSDQNTATLIFPTIFDDKWKAIFPTIFDHTQFL